MHYCESLQPLIALVAMASGVGKITIPSGDHFFSFFDNIGNLNSWIHNESPRII